MMTNRTRANIDHGLTALRLAQLRGDADAPVPGEVSINALARRCNVSADTIARIERRALAKLAAQLRDLPELRQYLRR